MMLCGKLLLSQTELYVQPIGIQQGLSQNSVLSIYQDSLGFIWMGTRDGLNLYSGNRVKVYKSVPGDSGSISGNIINDITGAGDDNLWIAHNKGVSFLNRKTETFKNYDFSGLIHTNSEIRSVSIINNQVWASGWAGVFVYNNKSDRFEPLKISIYNQDMFSVSTSKIVEAPNKEVWFGTSKGLFRYDTKTKKLHKPNSHNKGNIKFPEETRVEDIIFHPNGKVYLATNYHGLYECDLNGTPLRNWSSKSTGHFNANIDNIRALAVNKKGELWIGGFLGIFILNTEKGIVQKAANFHGADEIAANISVRSLLTDKNGSMWIGTYHNGAMLYDDYLSRFKIMPLTDLTAAKTVSYGVVSSFANTGPALFVGTESGYLLQYDQNLNRKAIRHLYDAKTGNNIVIKSLFYNKPENTLWIGTLRNGLYRLQGNAFVPFALTSKEDASPFQPGVINQVLGDEQNNLWLVSDKGGALNLFDAKNGKLLPFYAEEKIRGLATKGAGKHLLQLKGNAYLLSSHSSGLIYFENKPGGVARRIIDDDVNHCFIYNDKIYVSTNGNGLIILNNRLIKEKQLTTSDGLLNNIVLSASADISGVLWINTFSGVSSYTAATGFSNFHYKNGFPFEEINQGAYAGISENSSLIIGGKNAWAYFKPAGLFKNPYMPRVYITDIKIANQPVHLVKGFEDTDILNLQKLNLGHDQTTLTLMFAGLNYLMPQNNAYRYRLEGLDKDWRYTDYRGVAEFNKIPRGNYVLRIQAANNDGVWSNNIFELPVKVYPPWWLSWQAFILYAILIAGGIFLIRYNAIKSMRLKHNLKLEQLEKEKMDEMHRLKVRHFTDISHEIRTPLTLILSPIEELLEETSIKPKDKKKIQSIRYYGRSLMLLVNQLLEINRAELKKDKPEPEPVLLKVFFEQVNEAFKPLASSSLINWNVDASGVTENAVLIDKKRFEKVLLNLLSNAFKFTPEHGNVSLFAKTTGQQNETSSLQLIVTDTGRGIDAKDLPHIFDRFYKAGEKNNTGSGIGLSLTKSIVEDLMKGNITAESKAGEGTSFTVIIPGLKYSEKQVASDAGDDFSVPPEYLPVYEKETVQSYEAINTDFTESLLVVEDNPALLEFLIERLKKYYNVVGVTAAEEGLDVLQEQDIDLVISDIMLPGISGKDFCTKIKSDVVTSHIPVILLTAIQNEDIKLESLELGADDYIIKPFAFKELQLRINNILMQRQKWRELYKAEGLLPVKSEARFNKFDNELMQTIDSYIEKNIDNAAYSIEQLGKDAGLSRVHLYRKLKKLTGLTPSQYLRNYRLKEAIEILANEDIRIADLAYRVGFQDQHYFLKCFKDRYGVSPTQYAKQ